MHKQITTDHKVEINLIPAALILTGISLLGFFLTINIDLISAFLCGIGIVGAVFMAQVLFERNIANSISFKNSHQPIRFILELTGSLVLIFFFFTVVAFVHPDVTAPGIQLAISFTSQSQIVLSILSSHCLVYLYKFNSNRKHYYIEAAIATILTGILLTYGEQDILYNTNEYLSELIFSTLLVGYAWIIFQIIRRKYQHQGSYFLLKRGMMLILAIIPMDIFLSYLFLKFTYDIALYKDYWYVEIPFKIFILMAINFADAKTATKHVKSTRGSGTLKIKNGDKVNMVPTEDIYYFHVLDGINYLHTRDKKRLMVDESLNHLIDQLNDHVFFRANRQLIISKSAVESYQSIDNKKIKINLKGSAEEFIISRITAPEFRKWMAQ